MRVSIVIPVYNEKNTFPDLFEAVKKAQVCGLEKEIVIVDDCSVDGTRQLLSGLAGDSIKVVFHEKNTGKGGALRTGFEKSTGDIIIIQDADLEYDPNEYEKLVGPILSSEADIVYGSRFLNAGGAETAYSTHRLANLFLTYISNLFSGIRVTDMETCYKVFKRSIVENVSIEENRFGFEPEITAKLAKLVRDKKAKITEVPVSYNARSYKEGKKIGLKDGVRAIWCIIKYNDSRTAVLAKYAFCGTFVAFSQYLTMVSLVEVFGFRDMFLQNIANIISIFVSFAVAFVLHSSITWGYKFSSISEAASKFLLFLGISGFSLVLRALVFYAFSLYGADYRLNTLIGIVLIVAVNFIGYGAVVFKKPD